MRKSITGSFAAALILSTLAPVALFAQNTAAPPSGPAATTTQPTMVQPKGKVTKQGMSGNRAMMQRNGRGNHRHFHRGNYGRLQTNNNKVWRTGTMTNPPIAPKHAAKNGKGSFKGTPTSTTKTGAVQKSSGRHHGTTTARHVAKHSSGSTSNAKVTHVSHRR